MSTTKLGSGDHLLSDLTMKSTTYNRQTTPHISYINTLSYKIKSLTLLKQNNSQNKLAQKSFVSSVGLTFKVRVYGKFRIS